ncbi:Hsp70 family protein, partial [Streptococcus suis]
QLSIDESVFCERSSESGDYGIEITRDEFNSAVSVLVKDTELKMNQTLAASGLTWEAIDHILLVGGATRMPIIRQMVSSVSRKTIH